MSEKIIGIVGGMGPYATAEFYKNIIKFNKVEKDWNHPRILIDSNTKIPSRTRSVLYGEKSPAKSTIESINNLSLIGADFIAMPCNSIHYWYDEISSKINISWINMLKVVAKKIEEKELEKPLILGGYIVTKKKIYSKYIKNAKYLNEKENRIIESMITTIKNNGKLENKMKEKLKKIIKSKEKEIDSIVFACTELTKNIVGNFKSIDSNEIYAKYVLNFAMGGK